MVLSAFFERFGYCGAPLVARFQLLHNLAGRTVEEELALLPGNPHLTDEDIDALVPVTGRDTGRGEVVEGASGPLGQCLGIRMATPSGGADDFRPTVLSPPPSV